MTFSEADKNKLRAAFLTYTLLKKDKDVKISEFCYFMNNHDYGLNSKGVSVHEMSQIVTRDSFLMKYYDVKKVRGVNVFSLKENIN